MKQLLLSVGLLWMLTPWGAAGELAPIFDSGEIDQVSFEAAESACQVSPTNHYLASIEVLSWRPHMRGLDYAVTESGTSSILGTATVHNLTYDRSAGVRGQLGFISKVGWGLGFGYTGYGTEGEASVVRPGGVGQLFSSSSHPAAVEEADVAASFGEFDYDVIDVEARYSLHDARYLGLDLFGGFRWANIQQTLRATYDGRDYDRGVIQDELDVGAYGVRVGAETHWRMAKGFSLFARGAFGALYGQVDNAHLETNLNGAEILTDAHDSFAQPVTNVETAGGVSWALRCVQLSVGYELSIWENVFDRFRFIDDIEEGTFAPISNNLLLEGFYFRLTTVW